MCGPIHARLMSMADRHLKSLKDLVRQRACSEGSMVEGYMVYQSMVYITQYCPLLASNMQVGSIWDVNFINKFEGENLLGKGRLSKVKGK